MIYWDTHPCVVSLGIQQRNGEGGSQVGRVEHISESQTTFTQKSKSQRHFPLTTTAKAYFQNDFQEANLVVGNLLDLLPES